MTQDILADGHNRKDGIVSPDWTVILPFYNEAPVLDRTIESLSRQTEAFVLILVDNGSTDDGADRAAQACERHGVRHHLICERRPGKVAALDAGLKLAQSAYVATCDADTYYPPDYLLRARKLLRNGAMAGAWFIPRSAGAIRRSLSNLHLTIAARLFPTQCLTGGAGQAFRREALLAAGGFDPGHWNLVLEDHEVCHRLVPLGALRYAPGFWCDPADRSRNRPVTRWSTLERLVYHASAARFGDWFFYRFLKPRLETRRLDSAALREIPA